MKKTHSLQIKKVLYENKKIYCLNTYDDEELNGFSEFFVGPPLKVFTAISLLILHQTKKINIFENIGKYMETNDSIKHFKIFDVMNHIAGLKPEPKDFVSEPTFTDTYLKYKDSELTEEKMFREKEYIYSNFGYVILGALIEKVTGKSLYEVIEEKILKPLKMNKTGIEEANITLYDTVSDEEFKYASIPQFKSCVSDILKFVKFPSLLNKKTLEILQDFYFCIKRDDGTVNIQYKGVSTAGVTSLIISYHAKNYELKDISVLFSTGKNDVALIKKEMKEEERFVKHQKMNLFSPLIPSIREYKGVPVSFPHLFYGVEVDLSDYTQIPLESKSDVVLGNLFLGSVRAARNKQWLEDNKIDFVVSIIDSPELKDLPVAIPKCEERWLHIDIVDETRGTVAPLELGALRNIVKITYEKLASGKNVFVHCRMGISRSATVVIALIMTYFGYPRDPAIRYVQSFRHLVVPAFPFYLLLGHLEEELKSEKK